MPPSAPLSVLILTAAYGEGHNAAARGLATALAQVPGVTATVLDPLAETYGAMYQASRTRYLRAIEKHPWSWALTYQALHHTPLMHAIEWGARRLRPRLQELIQRLAPQVIVSTYPLYGYTLQKLFPAGSPRPFQFYTIVTDSLTINSAWHGAPSDGWLVPNSDTAATMRRQGVPAAKLHTLGFPVPPCFAQARPVRPPPAEGRGRVLYMINAGRAEACAMVAALAQVPGLELAITTGRDEALRTSLAALLERLGHPARLLGWVKNMPQLLMEHHVLVGKAGGATVQEAIAAVTPMVITKVIPGQEEGNAQLLLQHGCAQLCPTPAAAAEAVRQFFADGAARWHAAAAAMAALNRPDAALQMAQFLVAQARRP